jgi:hypothetical protein
LNWLADFWLSLTDGPDPFWGRKPSRPLSLTQREIDQIVRVEELERQASIMAAIERRQACRENKGIG